MKKNWQATAMAIAAAVLLMQGLQAQSRDTGQNPTPHWKTAAASPAVQTERRNYRENVDALRSVKSAEPIVPSPPTTAATPAPQQPALLQPERTPAPGNPSTTLQTPTVSKLPSPSDDDALDVASAERIVIKFQGQPELSGEYRINDDRTISVPVVGRVSVARMDPADLEKLLAERVSRLTGREAFVTVEIAEYRPVFVSGYVSRPGTAPWKPGLTVLQAITIAGGDYRTAGGAGDNVALRAQRAVDDQKRILAQIARLEAERSGASKISVPDRLIARVGKKNADELIAAQKTVFESRKSTTDAQVAGLTRAIALTKQEFDSMNAQRKRLMDQRGFRQEQFDRLKSLYDRGLLRNDRLHEEQLKLADIEEKLASIGVSVARANSTLVGLERELSDAQQKRNADIDAELLKLERDSAQFDLEIQSLGIATGKPPVASPGSEQRDTVSYEIVRQDRTGGRTITADRYSVLKPGDMVVVSMK